MELRADLPGYLLYLTGGVFFLWLALCAYYDLFRAKLVPHHLNVSLLWPALIVVPIIFREPIWWHVVSALAAGLVPVLIRMGLADAKTLFVIGWVFSFLVLPIFMAATVTAALIVVSVWLFQVILRKPRWGRKTQMPFVPSLYAGSAIFLSWNFHFPILANILLIALTLLGIIGGFYERKYYPLPDLPSLLDEQKEVAWHLTPEGVHTADTEDFAMKYARDRYRIVLREVLTPKMQAELHVDGKTEGEYTHPNGHTYLVRGEKKGRAKHVFLDRK